MTPHAITRLIPALWLACAAGTATATAAATTTSPTATALANAPAGSALSLADCHRAALGHSPDSRALLAQVEAARAWQRQAARWPQPEFGVQVLGGDTELALTQELDLWGKRSQEALAAGAGAEVDRAALAALRRALLDEVNRHFWTLAGAEALLTMAQNEAVAREALLKIREAEAALDAFPEEGLLTLRELSAALGQRRRGLEFEAASARARLNLLMGRSPDDPLSLLVAAPEIAVSVPELVLARATAADPAVVEAKARATAAGFQIELERRRWLPNPRVGPALKQQEQEWSYGVQLSFSVPVWDQNRAGIRAAGLKEEAAQAQIAAAEQAALAATWHALLAFRSLDESLADFERTTLALARERLQRAEQGSASGVLSQRELLEVRLTVLERTREFERLRHERHLAASRLALLLGTPSDNERSATHTPTQNHGR